MKRAFLLLLVLALVLPLLALVPAHKQIRSIAPSLPDFEAIAAALDTASGPVRVSFLNSASQSSPAGTLGHPGILIEWGDGRIFLLDTGMPPARAIAFGKPIELLLDAQPTQVHGSLAQQLGDRVDRIAGIAFTHLHSDHTDGLPEICAGQKYPATIFQTPLQFHERNYTTDLGFAALSSALCPRRQLHAARVMPLQEFPGLVAVSLGGHTPGSTLYVARVDNAYWMFSGDITNDKKSLLEDLPKQWVYSALVVPENTQRTAELRRWLRDLDKMEAVTVLPAHDVEAMAAVLPTYWQID